MKSKYEGVTIPSVLMGQSIKTLTIKHQTCIDNYLAAHRELEIIHDKPSKKEHTAEFFHSIELKLINLSFTSKMLNYIITEKKLELSKLIP